MLRGIFYFPLMNSYVMFLSKPICSSYYYMVGFYTSVLFSGLSNISVIYSSLEISLKEFSEILIIELGYFYSFFFPSLLISISFSPSYLAFSPSFYFNLNSNFNVNFQIMDHSISMCSKTNIFL